MSNIKKIKCPHCNKEIELVFGVVNIGIDTVNKPKEEKIEYQIAPAPEIEFDKDGKIMGIKKKKK